MPEAWANLIRIEHAILQSPCIEWALTIANSQTSINGFFSSSNIVVSMFQLLYNFQLKLYHDSTWSHNESTKNCISACGGLVGYKTCSSMQISLTCHKMAFIAFVAQSNQANGIKSSNGRSGSWWLFVNGTLKVFVERYYLYFIFTSTFLFQGCLKNTRLHFNGSIFYRLKQSFIKAFLSYFQSILPIPHEFSWISSYTTQLQVFTIKIPIKA